jgi:hypothetical protein
LGASACCDDDDDDDDDADDDEDGRKTETNSATHKRMKRQTATVSADTLIAYWMPIGRGLQSVECWQTGAVDESE